MTTRHYFGQRNTWGLTVKKGPWKVGAKDNAFAIGDQSHAGHLGWKTVERPALDVDQYKIPQFINNSVKYYGGGDYVPNTRPGRIQYASPRDKIARNYGMAISNHTPTSTRGEGQNHFQVGGDGNFGSPGTSTPSTAFQSAESTPRQSVGNFSIDGQEYYSPYGGSGTSTAYHSAHGSMESLNHDPIDDLAPPSVHDRNPFVTPLADLVNRQMESTVNDSEGIIQNTNIANLITVQLQQVAAALHQEYPGENWTEMFKDMSPEEIEEALNMLAGSDGPGGAQVEPELPASMNPNPQPANEAEHDEFYDAEGGEDEDEFFTPAGSGASTPASAEVGDVLISGRGGYDSNDTTPEVSPTHFRQGGSL